MLLQPVRFVVSITVGASLLFQIAPASAAVQYKRPVLPLLTNTQTQSGTTYPLPGGKRAVIGKSGLGIVTDRSGARGYPIAVMPGAGRYEIMRRLLRRNARPFDPAQLIAVLPNGTSGQTLAVRRAALQTITFDDIHPLFPAFPGGATRVAVAGAYGALNFSLSQIYVMRVHGADSLTASKQLVSSGTATFAEPDWRVDTMIAGERDVPVASARRDFPAGAPVRSAMPSDIPTNFGLVSSFQSYLNANALNAIPAFAQMAREFHQLPGQGEIVTNISLGDLTDASMTDDYVAQFGTTTRIIGGQRYLDIPSMPLIPTYTADASSRLNPLGSVEGIDPSLSEVLLDFSVMAPLPHDRQRPSAQGDMFTDLLGIAPGAEYRLVVPQAPSFSNIETALLAAALQQPRPNVITASLGFPEDSYGFPGRYLEDDPIAEAIVSTIVRQFGIVVCLASNDGTRQYTRAAVGPDGGSAATDTASAGAQPTTIADIGFSTSPSQIYDSGAIAAGGTTLDDVFSVPPQPADLTAPPGVFAETRLNGSAYFSSGYGSRIDVSTPSDNIAALAHGCCDFGTVQPVLESGTSASAPMIAAAAAVLLQGARLSGRILTPGDVRTLLEQTGRPVLTPPQIDRELHVGPQIDVSAALDAVLPHRSGTPGIVRFALAERQPFGNLGQDFLNVANPQNLHLDGPYDVTGNGTGQNLVDPLTFSADIVNLPAKGVQYRLLAGAQNHVVSTERFPRVLPAALFTAAGIPLVSSSTRTIPVTFEVLLGGRVVASSSQSLIFGGTDGTYAEATAPRLPPQVEPGQDVTASYDIANVRDASEPMLVISSIDHWSPFGAPQFRISYSIPLAAKRGTVRIPASAFAAGEGVYGVGIYQNPSTLVFGEFTTIRVGRKKAERTPSAVFRVDGQPDAHFLSISGSSAAFRVAWNVTPVGASGAYLEISAPGPTIANTINTFTNQNGDRRDANGIDTGSSAYIPLPGPSGVLSLNAQTLGLPPGVFYTLRVLAAGSGGSLQASNVISLEYDDSPVPGGESITDFAIDGAYSSVATALFGMNGPVYSALLPFDPDRQSFGAPLADDGSGENIFIDLGHSSALHRTVAIEASWLGSQQLVQGFDDATGARANNIAIDALSQLQLSDGQLDPGRGRAALLGWAPDGSSNAVAVDLKANSIGSLLPLDAGLAFPGAFNTLVLDRKTGRAFTTFEIAPDSCFLLGGNIKSVDFDTSSVSELGSIAHCVSGVTADDKGRQLYVAQGPLLPFGGVLSTGQYFTLAQNTLLPDPARLLAADSVLYPAYDARHGILVLGFLAGSDYTVNNNSMSEVRVYDTATGEQLSALRHFNFIGQAITGATSFWDDRGIQLDTVHRIGYTFGPGASQIVRFRY